MRACILLMIAIITFFHIAFASEISPLPKGAHIVAGDPTQDEFFILSGDESSQSKTPAPTFIKSSKKSIALQKIVAQLDKTLQRAAKPSVMKSYVPQTVIILKKPTRKHTIKKRSLAFHQSHTHQHHAIHARTLAVKKATIRTYRIAFYRSQQAKHAALHKQA